jgi:hypothetical protein
MQHHTGGMGATHALPGRPMLRCQPPAGLHNAVSTRVNRKVQSAKCRGRSSQTRASAFQSKSCCVAKAQPADCSAGHCPPSGRSNARPRPPVIGRGLREVGRLRHPEVDQPRRQGGSTGQRLVSQACNNAPAVSSPRREGFPHQASDVAPACGEQPLRLDGVERVLRASSNRTSAVYFGEYFSCLAMHRPRRNCVCRMGSSAPAGLAALRPGDR